MSKDYSYVDVYGYNVRYITKENGCKMYFAADLIRQYNTNNGTNKELKNCLKAIDTKELIKTIASMQRIEMKRCFNNRIICDNVIEYLNYLESKVEARILPSTSSRDENGLFLMKLNLSVGLLFNDCFENSITIYYLF